MQPQRTCGIQINTGTACAHLLAISRCARLLGYQLLRAPYLKESKRYLTLVAAVDLRPRRRNAGRGSRLGFEHVATVRPLAQPCRRRPREWRVAPFATCQAWLLRGALGGALGRRSTPGGAPAQSMSWTTSRLLPRRSWRARLPRVIRSWRARLQSIWPSVRSWRARLPLTSPPVVRSW